MVAVLVNVATVLLGSTVGLIFRNKINEKFTKAVISALALVTILIGLSSALGTADILCVIICMALGTIIGELIRIDDGIEGAGDFIKKKLLKGKNSENRFTEGFVTACIVFCVGSMTIMGSFEACPGNDARPARSAGRRARRCRTCPGHRQSGRHPHLLR